MAKQQMSSETRGIGQLLNERRYFEVPAHQRDYAWPIGAVEQYLDDVTNAMNDPSSDYFLGLLVLVGAEDTPSKRYEILDGQQRLATTTMIYSAIRQWLRDNGLDAEAAKIQNDFIGISEIGEEQDEPRIVLNVNNRDVFQELIVNPCPDKNIEIKLASEGRYTSTRKLLEAALLCRKYIANLAEKQGYEKKQKSTVLFQMAKYIRDRVQVNCLDVSAPENAYTIFESLNDRGIDLSVLDLLKNHLLREAGNKEAVILSNWTKMISTIGDRKGDDFLKAFWTSRFGRIQRGRLFKELKSKYSSKTEVAQLSNDLARVADCYGNLEISDSDLWRRYSETTRTNIEALILLGAKQTHPILLSAIEKLSVTDVEKLTSYLVTVILRYQLIGRGRTGKLEIQSAAIASNIWSGKLKSAHAVWENLKAILPADEEFLEDFSRYAETKSARARWILRELEIQKWKNCNPGKSLQSEPVKDPSFVNLEHILPKNPSQDWADVISSDKEFITDCLNRLGNLCLLDKPNNKKEASGSYENKCITYKSSEFILTREVSEKHPHWDRAAVESRQKALASLAVERWPV
ncbi:DUF262 domain-containing HNH endonuclease family protein [Halomonas sp. CS7]|uniref:DUF262 domain-containing HNH endonuclease family protein n=1 Tax=Halomonas pelophila TaxID=3151122 RepID=A0ABV1N6N8_9GAMM